MGKMKKPSCALGRISFLKGENKPVAIALGVGNSVLFVFQQLPNGEILLASSSLPCNDVPQHIKEKAREFFLLTLEEARKNYGRRVEVIASPA